MKKPASYRWLQDVVRCHPILTAFILGCVYFTWQIGWMFGLRTAEIASPGIALTLVTLSAAIIMISGFASGFAWAAGVGKRLTLHLRGRWGYLVIPAVWVASEYLRSIFFSIIALGPDGRVGPFWTFGSFGYWLVDTPLVYAARWGGLYLLSFIVVAVLVASFQAWRHHQWRPLVLVVAATFLLSLSGWWFWRTADGPTRTVGAMQYSSSATEEATDQPDPNPTLVSAPPNQLDTLVLPEYSHLWERTPDDDTAAVTHILREPTGLVIDSVQERNNSYGHNIVAFHDATGQTLSTQAKWFAIPGGEYVPYVYQVILAYAGHESLLLNFNDQKSIESGDKLEQPYEFNGVRYGALACSAAIAPELYRGITARGATLLTNSAALDTMGTASGLYHEESRDMIRLHAVANARPVVQSAKGGYAYLIDHNGQIKASTSGREYKFIQAPLTANSRKTAYTVLGDWIAWGSVLVVLILLFRPLAQRFLRHK